MIYTSGHMNINMSRVVMIYRCVKIALEIWAMCSTWTIMHQCVNMKIKKIRMNTDIYACPLLKEVEQWPQNKIKWIGMFNKSKQKNQHSYKLWYSQQHIGFKKHTIGISNHVTMIYINVMCSKRFQTFANLTQHMYVWQRKLLHMMYVAISSITEVLS